MMRLLCAALLLLTGCKAHHLFGPATPPDTRVRKAAPLPKCFLTITYNGVTHRYPIPCDE